VKESTLDSWLGELASRTPTPGGGAVAALAAATSAALVGMVTNYTTGAKWADREERMHELNAEAAGLRAAALELAEQDAVAFAEVGAAYRLPKETDADKAVRAEAIQRALVAAARPPRETGELAVRLVTIADELVVAGNPNVVSDVAVAASNARSALEAAIVNIEINTAQIRDEASKVALAQDVGRFADAVKAADEVTRRAREVINK
jgi:formiminotetrahydrofolate cyclodeaminase